MVTITKASDIKKTISKHSGEEEPVTIAQRFLNIFRQLHIFNEAKREEFKKMILELPPEIRGMFGTLPGGGLLQEYVDELEQQAGMVRDKTSPISNSEMDAEISKAKILATALAEAQIQAHSQIQAHNFQPVPNNEDLQNKLLELKDELLHAKRNNDFNKIDALQKEFNSLQDKIAPQTASSPTESAPSSAPEAAATPQVPKAVPGAATAISINTDEKFAQSLGQAIASAMENFNRDANNTTKGLAQAQLEIAKAIQFSNEHRKNESAEFI